MGCPSKVQLGNNLTFTVNTHTPGTGAATDADAVPAFRVYEDENGTAISNGNMAKLDDANTLGFYSEQLECTTGNGYESGKNYAIYISAAVGGVTGTISYNFLCEDLASKTDVVDEMETQMAADASGFKVNTVAIADGIITEAKLGADCITNAKIADGALAEEQFANVEGDYNPIEILRGIAAGTMNDVEDDGLSFRDIADTKDRFTVVVDESANRNVTIQDLT